MAEKLISRPPGADVAAILFDLDGTLVDSAADLMESLNAILRREGLPDVDLQETRAMIGDGVSKLIERALARVGGNPHRATELVDDFLAVYEPRATVNTRLYPDVANTLSALHGRCKLGLVTNKPERAARAILAGLGVARFFDAVIGGDTLAFRKPRPEPLLAALERLGATAAQAIMVGDNHHDVQAARAAGVRSAIVSWGYSHGPVVSLGADAVIATMTELFHILGPDRRL